MNIGNRVLILCFVAPYLMCAQDFARPFGPVTDADVDRLAEFAKIRGFDLKSDVRLAYHKDTAALGRLFQLSVCFQTLDANARTYGQIVYSSLLNLSDEIGIEAYISVLNSQPVHIQQLVRDFLYYPNVHISREKRREVEGQIQKAYPALIPQGFRFGHDDPVFAGSD